MKNHPILFFIFLFFFTSNTFPQWSQTDLPNIHEISSYLSDCQYQIIHISAQPVKGATHCSYYSFEDAQNRYFVKCGEKVGLEVENQIKLENFGHLPSPKIQNGSSKEKGVLVRKFLAYPNFGFEQVESLYHQQISIADFLQFQKDALNLLQFFYHISLKNYPSGSKMFDIRLQERLSHLLQEEAKLLEFFNKMGIYGQKRSIMKTPIQYTSNNLSIDVPCIEQMVSNVIDKYRSLDQTNFKYIIHGDFHVPNIICHENKQLNVIDLSDVRFGEDPSWDLGKWLNHITRLHSVVRLRDSNKPDPEIFAKFEENSLFVMDHRPNLSSTEIQQIRESALQSFCSLIPNENPHLIHERSTIAEFVVNVSTLERHMKHFPHTTKGILCCIVRSYLDLMQPVHVK